MTALNFTVLLDKVEDGSKTQSIRQATPHNLKLFKVGREIKLYTGMRQRKWCKIYKYPKENKIWKEDGFA